MQIPFLTSELADERKLRVEKIRKGMRREGIDALLIADNSNLYYISGCMFRGYAYISLDKDTLYFVVRPAEVDDDKAVVKIRKPELILSELGERGYPIPAKIGLEFDSIPYSDIKRLGKVFEGAEVCNSSAILRKARMVKTDYEIEKMRIDGLHQAAAYREIPHLYQEEMTDVEFQIEIERVLRREGCLGFGRVSGNLMEINLGSVINGDNADTPTPYEFAMGGAGTDPSLPGGADGSIMHPGTTVMVDMNGTFNGYQTDMTRVWSIGEIPELARKAHQCSIKIMRELEKIALPGVMICELYNRAMEIVKEHQLEKYFMGHRQQVAFIGHGVGIQLNEQPAITPRNKTIIEANMTLAIEPKFVIPGVGAVGVENTYQVTPEGLRNLTPYPEEISNLR